MILFYNVIALILEALSDLHLCEVDLGPGTYDISLNNEGSDQPAHMYTLQSLSCPNTQSLDWFAYFFHNIKSKYTEGEIETSPTVQGITHILIFKI